MDLSQKKNSQNTVKILYTTPIDPLYAGAAKPRSNSGSPR